MAIIDEIASKRGLNKYVNIVDAIKIFADVDNSSYSDVALGFSSFEMYKKLQSFYLDRDLNMYPLGKQNEGDNEGDYDNETLAALKERKHNAETVLQEIKNNVFKNSDISFYYNYKTYWLEDDFINFDCCKKYKPQLAEKLEEIKFQSERLQTTKANQSNNLQSKDRKNTQGDDLLILGAVLSCIKPLAKNNYTQQSLIDAITSKYKANGISTSTLQKKFAAANKHLEQRVE